ncbi:hypothetical protein [Polaribacter gangjinensis]|nr:hypothetical protein [Polaribacter gangjinensis]
MKKLLALIFLTYSSGIFSQNKSEYNCVNDFDEIETEVELQKTVRFKIISSRKLYTKETFEFSEGILIVSNLNEKLNPKEIAQVISTIGIKNNLSKITAFETCHALEIYYKNTKPNEEELNHLKENLIIELSLDINKSLSKKERKRNKKKRDFIETNGINACKVLSKNKPENFSEKDLSNVIVSESSKNIEKMLKIYDLSFEEGSLIFMKDLTTYLVDNCKIIKDFVERN